MRAHLNRVLLVSAAMLLASTAYGQSPNASPQGKGHAADEAKKAAAPGAKPDEKAKDKADDKKADEKKDEKGKSGSDRASRVAKQHEDQKAKLQGMLKGPMVASVKEELRRHAERTARIERIKAVATEAKDTDAVDRAGKLLGKENARHDRWMEKHVATAAAAAAPGAAAPGTAVAVPPTTPAAKGDSK